MGNGRRDILVALLLCTAAVTAEAQRWNDERALALARLATERRAQQLADSGLVDYRALAHGYLTFLAQLGEGFQEPPRVVKADELALEVFWHAPNLSKQRIVGRRDTTLLPTDIAYHRDHLGIVQNNFPAIIRLGDGDEVRDVPHPLSHAGLEEYDFAIADSLRMTLPDRVISVYEVKVRPRDDRQPRVIGALYLDRDNGQVVRMALSFTRAAFKDRQLEDLFVVLENGLVGATYWLPRRQEIEIRRSATWLDYPVRGIIRGRWEITDYQLNKGLSGSIFVGPEIVATPGVDRYPWPSDRIIDSLPPDVRAVTADEIRRVQAEVRTLVRAEALRRSRGTALVGRNLTEFLRFNRVEGLALGAGLQYRLGGGFAVSGRARYGFADEAAKGRAAISWQRADGFGLELAYSDDHREIGDLPERSGVVNSLASQEFGSDATDPFGVRALGVTGRLQLGATRWSLELAREEQRPLVVNATAARGTFRRVLPAAPVKASVARLRLAQPTRLWWLGTEMRADGEGRLVRTESTTIARGFLTLEIERPIGDTRVVSRTILAAAQGSGALHPQELVLLGGPVTLPGYDIRSLVTDRAAAQRIEYRFPIPFPAISLGRFGQSAAAATLAPHATAGVVRSGGVRRSVGASLLFGFDLLRLDVSRGLDRGGVWSVSFDVIRPLWGVL